MIQSLKDLFTYYPLDFYAYFFLLLPVGVAVYRREFLPPVLLVVALYFGVRFLEETIFLYYVLIPKNTQSLRNGALILDILIIGEFYYLSSTNNQVVRKVIIAVIALACIIVSINYAMSGPGSISHTVTRLLMIVLALLYFNKILSENRVRTILLHSLFWVSAGFLFYGMGTFLTSLFRDYLLDPTKTSQPTYNLFSDMEQMLTIVLSMLAAIGFWTSKLDRENYIQPA